MTDPHLLVHGKNQVITVVGGLGSRCGLMAERCPRPARGSRLLRLPWLPMIPAWFAMDDFEPQQPSAAIPRVPFQRTGPAQPADTHDLSDFDEFYRSSVPALVAFLVWQGAHVGEAADIVQETMSRVCLEWSEIDHPMVWSRTAASRLLVRHIASIDNDADEQLLARNSLVSPSFDVKVWVRRHDVLHMLDQLPPRQRQVLAWTLEGYSPAEIASELYLGFSAVRSTLAQAHTTLADCSGATQDEREARVSTYHANLVDHLAQTLDIEAGLAAIIPAATVPDRRDDERAESDTLLLGFVQAAASWSPGVRLAMRSHPIFTIRDFQDRVHDLLLSVAPAGILAGGLAHMLQRVLHRILDRVVGLSPDLNRALDLDLDRVLDSARELGKHLDRDLDRIRDHTRELAHDLGSELVRIRALDRLPALDLDDGLDHVLGFDYALDRNLIEATNYAHLGARDLAHSLDRVHTLVGDLDRVHSFASELDQTIQAIVHFHQILSDVTAVDLRKVDLTSVPLTGLRWSTHTRWPPEFEEQIWRDSVQIAEGIFEIGRGGTTHVPTKV